MNDKKINSSIVFKLCSWHLFQLFKVFIWINIISVVLFLSALLYRTETKIALTAESTTDYSIVEAAPKGIKLPPGIKSISPDYTKNSVRQIINNKFDSSFWNRLRSTTYKIWVPYEGSYYSMDSNIGENLVLFLKMFIVLLVLELLYLIKSIRKTSKAMRMAMMPIAELTETARSINKNQSAQPTEQLRDLTGTIDTINAAHLDTRIQISSSQDELKDLTGAINSMLDRINDSYRSQVRFVSDASHELRTPIAVIQGYANLLDRWGKNDEKALLESIEAIKSEADSMKDLVEQLLFLARGDNNSMQISKDEINLNELVSEVLRETKMIDKTHEFLSKIEETDINIVGDAQLIKQAIRIIVDNSLKYTPSGESIAISTSKEGDVAKVIVQDNGIGIPADNLPYVFDRFYRSDDSRTRKTGGTGLGLSIAKWIIDRHGGCFEILSRKDLGTRITISLAAE